MNTSVGRTAAPTRSTRQSALCLVLAALLAASACTGARSLIPGRSLSPHEQYAATLSRAGLDTSAAGADWLSAGEHALASPLDAALPFHESGYFAPERPTAVVYRISLPRGRVLVVDVQFTSSEPGRLFVDLFRVASTEGQPPDRIASLDEGVTLLRVEIDEDANYLLRLQPELLHGGRYIVTQRTEASLRIFPVQGASARAIQSGFGAPRNGGGRAHEGVDIFAPRGTPVVAVTSGVASPSANNLGGTVVWLRAGTGRTFYYAHLDRTAFDSSRRVAAGDVLGYVGNTGNARTTSPHLHFGIYARRPIDPLPFVAADDNVPAGSSVPLTLLGEWARTSRAGVRLRNGAHTTAAAGETLGRDVVFRVEAASGRSLRIRTPDNLVAYAPADAVSPTTTQTGGVRLSAATSIVDVPGARGVVVTELPAGSAVGVIGRHGSYRMVRLEDGTSGWLADAAPRAGD